MTMQENYVVASKSDQLWTVRASCAVWGFTIFCWVAACVAAPIAILISATAPIDARLAIATTLIILYSGTRMAVLIAAGRPRVTAGVFWLFVYVAMGIAPLCQVATDERGILADPTYVLPATILVIVGLIAYEFGGFLHKRLRKSQASELTRRRTLSISRLRLLSAAALITAAYYAHTVGLSSFLHSRTELTASLQAVNGSGSQAGSAIVQAAGTVPALIALLGWIAVTLRSKSRTTEMRIWCLVLITTNLVVNNFISNSRYWFLTVAISLAFAVPRPSARRFRIALVAGTLSAVIIFPYSDYFRVAAQYRVANHSTSIVEELSIKDYDQMPMTANGMWVVSNRGYAMGDQLLGDVFFWLPRSIWHSKPIDTGVIVGSDIQSSNKNLSSPLWIELWFDFGPVGVVLGFVALGYASRKADEIYSSLQTKSARNVFVIDLALPLFAGYQFIILRGPLLQAMGHLAAMAISLAWLRMPLATENSALANSHTSDRLDTLSVS